MEFLGDRPVELYHVMYSAMNSNREQAQPPKACVWRRAGSCCGAERARSSTLELLDLPACSDRNLIMRAAKSCSWASSAGSNRGGRRCGCCGQGARAARAALPLWHSCANRLRHVQQRRNTGAFTQGIGNVCCEIFIQFQSTVLKKID